MTNKEFYGDKLLAIALENACATFHRVVHGKNCGRKNCDDCEFSTVESIENWLNAEHVEPEPPLLENGDDLKPGGLDNGQKQRMRRMAKEKVYVLSQRNVHNI